MRVKNAILPNVRLALTLRPHARNVKEAEAYMGCASAASHSRLSASRSDHELPRGKGMQRYFFY